MTRLTNHIKLEVICAAVEKAGIHVQREALRVRRAKWAESVRIQAVGGKDVDKKINSIKKRFEKAIAELPVDVQNGRLFDERYKIITNVGGFNVDAYFNGHNRYVDDPVRKISPYDHTLQSGEPLIDDFNDIEAENNRINDEAEKIRVNVRGVLEQFTTVKKLITAWPEVEELLPDDIGVKPVMQLPAIKTEDLNAMIGIPTEN